MERITNDFLKAQIKRINSYLKDAGASWECGLDYAYGGVRLVKYEGSGERDLSYRCTKREMYYILDAAENIVSRIKD